MSTEWMPLFVDSYDPLLAGSIDGTDTVPHDKGIQRAMYAKYKPNLSVTGKPLECNTVCVKKILLLNNLKKRCTCIATIVILYIL